MPSPLQPADGGLLIVWLCGLGLPAWGQNWTPISPNKLYFNPSGTGFVGINTSNPQCRLDFGTSYGSKMISFYSVGSSTWYGFGLEPGKLRFQTASSGHFGFFAGNTERMTLRSTGNLGLGTTDPVVGLHILRTSPAAGTNEMIHLENGWNSSGLNQPAIVFRNGHTGSNAVYWSLAGRVAGEHYFDLRVNSAIQPAEKVVLRITEDGKAGLGTLDFSDPGYTFFLRGGLSTGKVKTTSTLVADYVFADGYALPSLAEVEAYVQAHRHLPGVVSQAEVIAAGGVELTTFAVQLQEKLEELYLHTIALEKRPAALEAENAALRQASDKP